MQPKVVAKRYQLARQLGRGGMGVVYEAIDQRTQQHVALKLLASAISEDMPDVVARFEREVKAASSIDSDHIVRVFDAGTEDGSPYMVMELVKGRDLHQWCKQLRQLRPEAVVRLAGQACEGLAAAHAVGVVHRDIKPGNIFLSERDDGGIDAKILDFGIAKLKMDQVQGDPGLTKTGNMLGSPHYMSPEQAQGLKTIDARTDIWSLGVVMYKALTGRTPFADLDSMGQVIIAIWSLPIPPVQDAAPWVSPELAAVVHKALQKKADDRYQSAEELLEALRGLLRGTSFGLTLASLEPLNDQMRSMVAPRLAEAGPEPLEPPRPMGDEASGGTIQPSIENTHPGEMTIASARKKAGVSLWVGSSLALVAVVAVVAGVMHVSRPQVDPATQMPSVGSVAPVVSSAPAVEPPKPVVLKGVVSVPGSVTAFVDGIETPIVEEKIEVSGPPGSMLMVTLKSSTHEESRTVKLTEKGPFPATLTMTEPAKVPGVGGRPGGGGGGSGGKVGPKGTPTAKPGGTADRGFD